MRRKKGPNVWVVPSGRRYAVKEEGTGACVVKRDTQYAAIAYARKLAKSNRSELIIQSREGRIRDKDSHGNDRFPPRG